jgi:hypothetical protein
VQEEAANYEGYSLDPCDLKLPAAPAAALNTTLLLVFSPKVHLTNLLPVDVRPRFARTERAGGVGGIEPTKLEKRWVVQRQDKFLHKR